MNFFGDGKKIIIILERIMYAYFGDHIISKILVFEQIKYINDENKVQKMISFGRSLLSLM